MRADKKHAFLFRMKPVLFAAILTAVFLSTWLSLVPASPTGQTGGKQDLVPSSFLRWPEKGGQYAVLVDKAAQKVFVYEKDNPTVPIKTYPCSTGEKSGKKSKQNDRRTPEGIYFFVNVHEQKDLAPIYGIRAFPIDYPNPMDRKEGRGGYGIWFHGTNKPLKPRDSNGCIVLENENLDDLSSFIWLHDTPVIISPKVEMVEPGKLLKEREELEKIIEGWRKAWEGNQVDQYMSYYSPRFTFGDKDWKRWKAYKTHLAKQHTEIRLKIENLALFRADDLVMASFHQHYVTPSIDSRGVKRLFLRQNSMEWKIMEETFVSDEDMPKPVAAVKRPKADLPTLPSPVP